MVPENVEGNRETLLSQLTTIAASGGGATRVRGRFGEYGQTVLDIECGIYPLHVPLALEGREIFAISSEKANVDTCTRALFDQEKSIRRMIEYALGDFIEYDFENRKFDTVVLPLWEVFVCPSEVVEKALSLLGDVHGELVFSANARDQRQELESLDAGALCLEKHGLAMEGVDLIDEVWLQIYARRRAPSNDDAECAAPDSPRRALVKSCVSLQQRLNAANIVNRSDREMLVARLSAQKRRAEELGAQIDSLKAEMGELTRARDAVQADVDNRGKELSDARAQADRLKEDLAERDERFYAVRAQAVKQAALMQDEIADREARLERLKEEKRERDEKLAQLEAEIRDRDEKLTRLEAITSQQHEKLVEMRAQADRQIAALLDEIDNRDKRIAEFRAQVEPRGTKIARLNERLKAEKKNTDAARKKAAQRLAMYNDVIYSKRYRVGCCLARIKEAPYMVFPYAVKTVLYIARRTKRFAVGRLNAAGGAMTRTGRAAKRKALRLLHARGYGVCVIIPTYKEIEYLDESVNSVLSQTIDPRRVDIILSVNGKDVPYYKHLKRKYRFNRRVKVIYTPKVGLSAARNFALGYVKRDFVTFLDDDDYFTKGYLGELLSHADDDVSIVCGRLVDRIEDALNADTYINKALSQFPGGGKTKDYLKAGSLFSPAWAKLYRTKALKEQMHPFRENLVHTEDIYFWADNFKNLTGFVYCCDAKGSDALVRRVLDNSMSRPSEEKLFQFWIDDRVPLLRHMAEKLSDPEGDVAYKRFLLNKIKSQTKQALNYYKTLDVEKRRKALEIFRAADEFYINKCLFAEKTGVAFCHNFPPASDASAYVASKRLPQIGKLEDAEINWTVVSSDMSNCRVNDNMYYMFYAAFVMGAHIKLPKPSYFNEKVQSAFGKKAFEAVKDRRADYLYSRSMYAGSHDAAYLYKQEHPSAKWYAEFSDPIYMGTDDKPRPMAKRYAGEEAYLNDYWRDIEQKVYDLADVIIFTNENQRAYMLGYNAFPEKNESILRRSVVMTHPVFDPRMSRIIPKDYPLDPARINIAYFGTFYANRGHADMLTLLKNDRVTLHLFVPKPNDLKEIASERVRVNVIVGHLEFLNIASKMDYLYLNDIAFAGEINPYLPSKFADYLSTGTKIIALIREGSVLSGMENKNLIKVTKIEEDFVRYI